MAAILVGILFASLIANIILFSLARDLKKGMDRMYSAYRGGDGELGDPPVGGSGIPSK